MASIAGGSTVGVNVFYTYFHTRNDTQKPFYIGKGSGKRAHAVGRERNKHWCNIVKKHGHVVHIAAEWSTESEALEHEKFLITCFRDMGIELCNMTDGGEGTSGWVPTSENRSNIGAAAKRRWDDTDYKKRVSDSILLAQTDEVKIRRATSIKRAHTRPEVKDRVSAAHKKLWTDLTYREKIIKSRLANKESPEERDIRIAKSTATKRTPEARAKTSEQTRLRWADPEYRMKMAISNNKAQTPERAKSTSEAMKTLWKNPEYVMKVMTTRSVNKKPVSENTLNLKRALWKNPEYIDKMKIALVATRTQEALAKRAATMRELWKNPKYLEKMKNRRNIK